MAKLTKGIFGPVSGKIGSLVGANWKGIGYLRSLPTKRKKNARQTPAQIANQEKFKFVTEWIVPFHAYVTHGFKSQAINKTEINVDNHLKYDINHLINFSIIEIEAFSTSNKKELAK